MFDHRVKQLSHAAALVVCGLVVGPLLLGLAHVALPEAMSVVEWWTVDRRFRLRPTIPVARGQQAQHSDLIVVVDYDDAAAAQYGFGRWPWDRRIHAELIDWLSNSGATAIVVDLLFDLPARDGKEDVALVEAVRRSGNVILPFVARETEEGLADDAGRLSAFAFPAEVRGEGSLRGLAFSDRWPLHGLLGAAAGFGHIHRTTDADGVLRRLPMVYAVKGGKFLPTLALAAAFLGMDVDMTSVRIDRGRVLRFKPKDLPEVVVPIDLNGHTWINYAGPWGKSFVHLPYSWVREQFLKADRHASLRSRVHGRVVIVANLTTGSSDQGPTPVDPTFPFSEVHAHVLSMLMTGQFLRDGDLWERILIYGIPMAILTVSGLVGGPGILLPSYAVLTFGTILVIQGGFDRGIILPAVGPLVALSIALISLLAARFLIVDRQRRRFLAVLRGCLPPQTIHYIKERPGLASAMLAGRRRELTILLADVKGFSTFCQRSDPLEIQRMLREYLSTMSEVIRQHGGTLDKYMGDGILAFFGDAEVEDRDEVSEEAHIGDHAASAVRAGLAMHKTLIDLNHRWTRQGRENHSIRIGINTGIVTVGNLGTEHLWDYTVVGVEVNRTQRLESCAPPGGLLLSRRTYALAVERGILPAGVLPIEVAAKETTVVGYPIPPELIKEMDSPRPAAAGGGFLSSTVVL